MTPQTRDVKTLSGEEELSAPDRHLRKMEQGMEDVAKIRKSLKASNGRTFHSSQQWLEWNCTNKFARRWFFRPWNKRCQGINIIHSSFEGERERDITAN